MSAPPRYPELFLAPEERTPESFWISLRYFNLYRVALAGLFFTLSLVEYCVRDAGVAGSNPVTPTTRLFSR